jgi:hypothetical protein
MAAVRDHDRERGIRLRSEALAAAFYRPVTRAMQVTFVAGALSVIAGLGVGLVTRQPVLAGVVATAVGVIGTGVAWPWLLAADHRAGLEVVLDHSRRERAEWKRDTGTTMPMTARGASRWLREHPIRDGAAADAHASMLLRVGRLAEAEAALTALEPRTPDEAFGIEIGRKTLEHMAGGRPDMAPLHSSWRSLPVPGERQRRRECLALLDAMIAVSDGQDAWPIVAGAKVDVVEIQRSARIPWLAATWLAYQLFFSAIVVWVTWVLVG